MKGQITVELHGSKKGTKGRPGLEAGDPKGENFFIFLGGYPSGCPTPLFNMSAKLNERNVMKIRNDSPFAALEEQDKQH